MPQDPDLQNLQEASPSRDGNPLINLFLDGMKTQAQNLALAEAAKHAPPIDLGAILNAAGMVMQAPSQVTQGALAPAFAAASEMLPATTQRPLGILQVGQPVVDIDGLQGERAGRGAERAAEVFHREGSGRERFQEAIKDQPGVTKLASDLATDPLTYLGAGVPGGLGKRLMPLLPKIGVTNPQTQLRVLAGFDYLDKADKAIANAPWKGTKNAFKGITGAIGDVRIPEALGLKMWADDSSSQAARTIGEWAGSQSRQSLHKKFTGQVKEIVHRLGPGGMNLDLEDVIQRQTLYDEIPQVSGVADAMKKLAEATKDLKTLGTDDYSKAIVSGIERQLQSLKSHAQITANAAKRQTSDPVKQAEIFVNAKMDLYWDAMSVLEGGRHLITNPKRGADFAAATAPGIGSASVDNWMADVLAEGRMARDGKIVIPNEVYDPKLKANVIASWETKKPGRSIMSAYLPDDLQKIWDREMPNFVKGMNRLKGDKETLKKALEDAWVAGKGNDPMPPGLTASSLGDDAYESVINPVLTGLGKKPVKDVKELMDQFRGLYVGDVQRTKTLEDLITRWKDGEDLFRTNPFELVGGSVMREKATQFGIKPKTGIVKILSDVTNAWKESVLMSGSYPITNVVSGISGAAVEGVNPDRTIRGLIENMPKATKGEQIHSNKARILADSLGVPLPADQSSLLNEANAVHEMTGEGMSVLQKWGPLKTAAIGGTIGAAGGAMQSDVNNRGEAIAVGAASGATLGASLPLISKYMQRIIRGAEVQMREDAWTTGTLSGVEKRLPALKEKIAKLFETQFHATEKPWTTLSTNKLNPGSRYGKAFYTATNPDDALWTIQGARPNLPKGIHLKPYQYPKSMRFATYQQFDAAVKKYGSDTPAIKSLQAQGYDGVRDDWQTAVWEESLPKIRSVVSPQRSAAQRDIEDVLDAKVGLLKPDEVNLILVRNGVDPVLAREVSQFWANQIQDATKEGTNLVARVHVNYEQLSNLEQAIKTGVPFATWPVKMTPFFAEHILSRPSVVLSLIKLNELSERAMKEQGLTPRFKGSVEVPLGSAVYSWLIGQPVRTFFNPLKGFLPASDASRMSDRAMESFSEGDPVRGGYEMAGAAGLGPHPMIDFAIRQLWPDMPARGIIRQAEPLRGLQAAMGINDGQGYDLNAAFTGTENLIKKARFGSAPPDLRENAILRRIDEMAVKETATSTKSGDARVGEYVAAKQKKSGPIWEEAARDVAKQRAAQTGVGFLWGALSPQAILTEEEAEIRDAQAEQDDPENPEGQIETLRGALQQMQNEGMGNDKAPPDTVADVVNLVLDSREADPALKPISETIIKATLTTGTWDSMLRLIDLAFPPNAGAAGGYGASGMPDVAGVTNEMQVYTNIGALAQDAGMIHDAERLGVLWEKYERSSPQSRRTMETKAPWAGDLRKIKQLRDNYLAAHPGLAAYLNQAEDGESIERFTSRTRGAN